MSEHLAVLEEMKSRLNAIEIDVACGNLSAAQTFTKVRDVHAAAIALMRGQSATGKLNGYMFREKAIEIQMDSEIPMWMTNTPGIRVTVSPAPPQQEPAE